ncbi:hypothetical protein BV394_14685 [Brevirhabdus pacifica]|uniref:Uncharacterized protein n=2 Tax=Brevirhabdus pacifica TaxID=1267768 RepID=A0A1U7DLD2_9RHOB|nr:heavy metal translocating P-type ATPase [Brevirhabdus pacifica]APX90804.1 hypothetical protein BV394_14685 [Brevirhabdus pacifica]OWU79586.1 hypothetical protein ATO5_00385 [Loktanella sp. 22II-4b]PJJ87311.1 Cu2+-exporting ATPase [Brevirhabdus pacifica]
MSTLATCPGCAIPPRPVPAETIRADLVLHLPDIHCAACIASVETMLAEVPGVRSARVNLTLRRAMVETDGSVEAPDLIARLAAGGHRASVFEPGVRTGQSPEMRDLASRIGVAGFAAMNVMLLSVAVWAGAGDVTARMFHLISGAIALPAVAWAGQPFFRSAYRALRAGRMNMDVPISLAIILASAVSLAVALGSSDRPGWFEAALSLTFFLLIGRYLDMAGRHASRSAAAELAALEVPQAIRLANGAEEIVPARSLAPGDHVLIRPGDRIPADGRVIDGDSDLDRSILTGESLPVAISPGADVAAGELNLTGTLTLRVTRAGAETGLARLAAMVATAEMQRSRYTGFADRASRLYAPAVHALGAMAFVMWWSLTGDPIRGIDVAISVLVITCPCALGLAVPAVSTVSTARLFRAGLLVRSPTALERLAEVDTVVFDKTGTLTTGELRLGADTDPKALALAAGLARGSSHPLSRAIAKAARARGISPAPVGALQEKAGRGVEGIFHGERIRLGRPGWAGAMGAGGGSVQLLDGAGKVSSFTVDEVPRPDAVEAVQQLEAMGMRVTLLSGDAPDSAARLARRLGIAEVMGGVSPEGKHEVLARMAAEGRRPLMVGDGLNDTGALAGAHASMAPARAVDAARSLADVVILSEGIASVATAVSVARRAHGLARQNVALAIGYNLVSVPVAFAGLASPLVAALAMSSSSLAVTLNAMRARK